ncbi:MAG: hypothetical protein H0T44_15980 [Gemmatimonadales bacterium]|nr:hypothetical protein [Gemmatimonadales bacterium]
MTGCLAAPFRLLGCLVLLAALVLGWLYRDRIVREGRRVLGPTEAAPAVLPGRPGQRALASARSKIDSLNGWRADSVVLTPAEVASLIGSGLEPTLRSELDSLQVRLLDDEIEVTARLKTARLPKEVMGPLAAALRPTEPIEAAGPLRVVGAGKGEWSIRSFRIRDFPVPADMVPELVARTLGDPSRRTVPVRMPVGIREIRLRPGGATLYGAPRS